MVELNIKLLIFFKKIEEINIISVSFIKIISLLNKNGKNNVFYPKTGRVLREYNIQWTLVLCFRVCCKKEEVRLGAI